MVSMWRMRNMRGVNSSWVWRRPLSLMNDDVTHIRVLAASSELVVVAVHP